ncbi:MAG: hypothetical protein O9273_06135 [Acetobacteraceae bacterium]|nr:hypothetical protein [Acetobacteraceae bacterium]
MEIIKVPAAIGVRGYCVRLLRRGEPKFLPIHSRELREPVAEFFQKFFLDHASSTTNEKKERMWFFEELQRGNRGDSQGYIHYGTFGYQAAIIDSKTKKRNYIRKITDAEQIPLFYDLWFPDGALFGLMAFQSFQGRSCKELVYNKMREIFEEKNPGYTLGFRKLMPTQDSSSPFGDAPVKRLVLKRRSVSSDVAENYLGKIESVDLELTLSAQGRGSLGKLSHFVKKMKDTGSGILTYEGKDYEEALVEVKIGKKIRRIGLTDAEGDFGVIDITDNVEHGPDGHPTYTSVSSEIREILMKFHEILRDEKK